MSRSYRHVPITGITSAASEKKDKRLARRAWRRALRQGRDILLQEIWDEWSMDKDGKIYNIKYAVLDENNRVIDYVWYEDKDMSDNRVREIWCK